jgi:hypothetical protein
MIVMLHVAILVVAFLLVLNDFLKGSKKAHIDIFLGLSWIGLLLVAFAAFGWQAGGLALGVSFVYGIVSRPLAARLAARLLSSSGGPSGTYVGLPRGRLAAISRELGRRMSGEQLLQDVLSGNRRERAIEALLDYCEGRQDIRNVMTEFGADRGMLRQLYDGLLVSGAGGWAGGHYVAASALAYPHALHYLLSRARVGRERDNQTAYTLLMHFERGASLE